MYDLAIIGGGPAATAAGVYASRKKIKTILIAEEFGGQSIASPVIQNWVGTISISGNDFAKSLKEHVKTYASDVLEIKEGERVATVSKNDAHFTVTMESGDSYDAQTVLIATGAHRRRLKVPGADEFEHKGVTYCATCDGPLFADQDVAVIGGGNAGFETAAQLLEYAKSVTLLQRSGEYRADPVTVEKVLANPKMTGLLNAQLSSIDGEKFVTELKYKIGDEEKELNVTGVFVEIGLIPTTGLVSELVAIDEVGRIVIDPWTQRASVAGVWAAGDCSNVKYHQNNIAAGDAVKALEDIFMYLKTK
jgi:alkyl hydroperoxide reductase subunit F